MAISTDFSRDEMVRHLCGLESALRAKGVTGLAIFGSRARGNAREDSDLDVLVDVAPDQAFSLFDLFDVQHIIQDATGIETQATLRADLDQRMSERIADDLIKVF